MMQEGARATAKRQMLDDSFLLALPVELRRGHTHRKKHSDRNRHTKTQAHSPRMNGMRWDPSWSMPKGWSKARIIIEPMLPYTGE